MLWHFYRLRVFLRTGSLHGNVLRGSSRVPKFDFSLHQGLNQSKIAIWTIHLRTWIVQIGISIWFQIFVPFKRDCFSIARTCSLINNDVSSGKSYLYSSFYAAKGLWCIKLKFHCNSKSIRTRKQLDFLTDLKLSNMCVQTLTTKDRKRICRRT